jgi:hypothetical protein
VAVSITSLPDAPREEFVMTTVLWFVLGGIFGSLATVTYFSNRQMKNMERMIARITKTLMERGEEDGN